MAHSSSESMMMSSVWSAFTHPEQLAIHHARHEPVRADGMVAGSIGCARVLCGGEGGWPETAASNLFRIIGMRNIISSTLQRIIGTLQKISSTLQRISSTLRRIIGTLQRIIGTLQRIIGTLSSINRYPQNYQLSTIFRISAFLSCSRSSMYATTCTEHRHSLPRPPVHAAAEPQHGCERLRVLLCATQPQWEGGAVVGLLPASSGGGRRASPCARAACRTCTCRAARLADSAARSVWQHGVHADRS